MSIVYEESISSDFDVSIHSRRSSTPQQTRGSRIDSPREHSRDNDSRSMGTSEETDASSGFFSLSEDDDDDDGELEDDQRDTPPASRHARYNPSL